MREQVCIYMCPWPRIQAAMLDENSLVVTLQRLARRARTAPCQEGDCRRRAGRRLRRLQCLCCRLSDGIDIRDGQQLECITCALCIDACDGVMDKIGKPRGLIAYATLDEYQSNMALATGGGACSIDPAKVRNPDGSFSDKIRHFDWRVIFGPGHFLHGRVDGGVSPCWQRSLRARPP